MFTLSIYILHILLFLSLFYISAPGYTLNNLGKRLQVWLHRHMGELYSQDIARIFKYRCCAFFPNGCYSGSSCPPGNIVFLKERTKDFMAGQDLTIVVALCSHLNCLLELFSLVQGWALWFE